MSEPTQTPTTPDASADAAAQDLAKAADAPPAPPTPDPDHQATAESTARYEEATLSDKAEFLRIRGILELKKELQERQKSTDFSEFHDASRWLDEADKYLRKASARLRAGETRAAKFGNKGV